MLVSHFKFYVPDDYNVQWRFHGLRYPMDSTNCSLKPALPLRVELITTTDS